MNHEIVALNGHLLDAKVTIDKLSEDNVSAVCIWLLEGMWQACSGVFPGGALAGRAFLIQRNSSLALSKGRVRAVRTWGGAQGHWERTVSLMEGLKMGFRRPSIPPTQDLQLHGRVDIQRGPMR